MLFAYELGRALVDAGRDAEAGHNLHIVQIVVLDTVSAHCAER